MGKHWLARDGEWIVILKLYTVKDPKVSDTTIFRVEVKIKMKTTNRDKILNRRVLVLSTHTCNCDRKGKRSV